MLWGEIEGWGIFLIIFSLNDQYVPPFRICVCLKTLGYTYIIETETHRHQHRLILEHSLFDMGVFSDYMIQEY